MPASPSAQRPARRTRPRQRARRSLLAAAGAAVAISAVAGCGGMSAALGKQWVDVTFKPNTSVTTIEKVRSACAHVPNIRAEPLPKKHTVLSLMAGVRFNTTKASDANVAELEICVQKFQSVQGFTPQDAGDAGG